MTNDWYFQQGGDAGLDPIDPAGRLGPRFDHALFNRIASEVSPGWREYRDKCRKEAEMLWHNQGLTYLSPIHRAGLTMISDGLRNILGGSNV